MQTTGNTHDDIGLDPDEMSDCTGVTATYCPVHGDCTCGPGADGTPTLDDGGCPLHSPTSQHPLTDRMIPTGDLTQDPRLRRLFATVGFALADGTLADPTLEGAVEQILRDLAPEYLPPDDWASHPDDASAMARQWQGLVNANLDAATGR